MAGRADIEAGRAFVRLFLKNDLTRQLAGAMKAAGQSVQQIGAGAMKAGAGLAAGGLSVLAPLGAAVAAFTSMGGEAMDAAARTGMSVESLSELGFAAEQTGASLADVETATKKMAVGIGDLAAGSKTAQNNFAALGLTLSDLQGLSPEAQFAKIATAIAAIKDPTSRTAAAVDMFGKSGTKLLPMLVDMDSLRAKARELGIVMSTQAAAGADDLGDALDQVKAQVSAAAFQIGAALAPAVLAVTKHVSGLLSKGIEWVKQNQGVVQTVAAVGAGLVAAGAAVATLGAAVYAAGSVLAILGGAILTVSGVAGRIGGAIVAPFRLLGTVAAGAAARIGATFASVWGGMRAGASAFANVAATITAGAAQAGAAIGRQIGRGVATAVVSLRALRAAGVGLGPAIGISLYRGVATAVRPVTGLFAGAFSRVRSMAAATGGFLRRSLSLSAAGGGLGRGLGGLVGAAGMLGAIGLGGAFAPLLAAAPIVLGVLGSIGTALAAVASPVMLLAAGVAAGAVAWVNWSSSGQAAWEGLLAAVQPIAVTLRDTFGNVKDAITGGQWALAGKLAIAGLKLAVFQGLAAIQDAFPRVFGAVLRTVGKVGDGVVKAWGKVTGFLTAQWNTWGKATLDTILEVAGLIPDIWQRAVEGLANSILSASAKGGVMGALASKLLGVDMSQEQAKAELAEVQRRQVTLRTKSETAGVVAQEIASGTEANTGRKLAADEIAAKQRYLAELQAQVADLRAGGSGSANVGQTVDVLADARQAVHAFSQQLRSDLANTGATTGGGPVSQAMDAFLGQLESGVSVADAQAELSALQAELAAAKQATATGPGAGATAAGPGAATAARAAERGVEIGPTFSAAAALAAGQIGGAASPQEKMVTSIYEMAKTLREVGLLTRQQTVSNAHVVTLYERFLAAMSYG